MANIKNKNSKKHAYLLSWNMNDDTNSRPWTMVIEAKDFNDAMSIFKKITTRKDNNADKYSVTDARITELRSDTLLQYRNDSKELKAIKKQLSSTK